MFTDEELLFIKTILEDELASIQIKKCKFDSYDSTKKYEEMIKPREYFIKNILDKMNKK